MEVIPSESVINDALKTPVCPYLNPEYVYRISRMFEIELGHKGPNSFPRVCHTGSNTSSVFTHSASTLLVVVMPVRVYSNGADFKYNELLGIKK